VWLTERATDVVIASQRETFSVVASGEQVVCLNPGEVVRLTVTGPGGQATGGGNLLTGPWLVLLTEQWALAP